MSARDPLPPPLPGEAEPSVAELAIQRTLAMLKGLFELMPVGISLMDMTTGRAVDVNDALCRMLGYSRDELLSMDLSVLTPPELRAERVQMFERALDLGHCGTYETVLLHRSGRPVHVLRSGSRIVSPDGRPHVWSVAQDISPRKIMEHELRAAATLDRLTGLPNRATLMRELQRLSERARAEPAAAFAVLFLDFDRFKRVNDTLGHAAGDALLCAVADRLQQAVRAPGIGGPGWLVARFGGDEFVILAPGLESPQAARRLGLRLARRLALPYEVAGKLLHSSASIGVAFSRGPDTETDRLMRDADTAMYEAKRLRRGSLVVFDEGLHATLNRASRIEAALRGAQQRGELQLVYQPVLDLATRRMVSAQALLRWHHPELGEVAPAEFLPMAEESGEILAIGDWLLDEACRQWARWQQQDARLAPASVGVRLSRAQLAQGEPLLQRVQAALIGHGLPPQALELSIPEGEAGMAGATLRPLFEALHARGIGLALDGFGCGGSSLAALHALPLQRIRIAPSLVSGIGRDPQRLAVARAVIQLVGNLGRECQAQGVQQADDCAALLSLGCRLGQGELFGPPAEATALLAAARALQAG